MNAKVDALIAYKNHIKNETEQDYNNIIHKLVDGVLRRIDRIANIENLSEEDKEQDINPEYITFRLVDIVQSNITYKDFNRVTFQDKIYRDVNLALREHGFCITALKVLDREMGCSNLRLRFDVLKNVSRFSRFLHSILSIG